MERLTVLTLVISKWLTPVMESPFSDSSSGLARGRVQIIAQFTTNTLKASRAVPAHMLVCCEVKGGYKTKRFRSDVTEYCCEQAHISVVVTQLGVYDLVKT